MNRDPDAILTLAEVAEYLKISPSTAWRWCKQKRIPGFQIGRSWRVKQSDLDLLINTSKSSQTVEHHIVTSIQPL